MAAVRTHDRSVDRRRRVLHRIAGYGLDQVAGPQAALGRRTAPQNLDHHHSISFWQPALGIDGIHFPG